MPGRNRRRQAYLGLGAYHLCFAPRVPVSCRPPSGGGPFSLLTIKNSPLIIIKRARVKHGQGGGSVLDMAVGAVVALLLLVYLFYTLFRAEDI